MAGSWSRGFHTRLVTLVLAAVIPAFGVIVFHAVQDRQRALAQTGRELQQLAQTVALDYRFLAEGERQLLSTFSHLAQARGNVVDCNRLAATLLEKSTRYVNLGIADRHGVVRCSALPVRRAEQHFQKTVKSKDPTVGTFPAGHVTDKSSVDFDMPILDDKGATVAVAFSAVNPAWLNEFIARTPMPAGAQTRLVNLDGTVFSHRPVPQGAAEITPADPSLLRRMRTQPQGGVARGLGPDGVMQVVGFAPLSATGRIDGHVLVALPLAAAYAEPNQRLLWNLGTWAAIALLMWFVLRWLGGRLVLRQMNELTQAAARFGGGDMSACTGLSHGKGEFGRVARDFDDMAQRMQRQVVEQRRSGESIRRLNRSYILFTRVKHAIVHQRERAALLQEFCRVAVDDGGFGLAWVGWIDGAYGLRPLAYHGRDQQLVDRLAVPVDADASPALKAARERRPDICNDIETDLPREPWHALMRGYGYRAWGAFPLLIEGNVVAVVNLISVNTGAFDPEEQQLLTEIAADVSFALDTMVQDAHRREAERRLTFIAYHDPVTELPNLLQYDELIKPLRERARAGGHSFALMIVGIERLQEVTATFGYHLEGELLRLIAQRLRQCVCVGDILARGAGANFNVVFSNADADIAIRSAHHLLKVMEQPFAIQGMDIELGVAIGVALFPNHGEEPDALNRCAYTALAEARKIGSGYVLYAPGQESFSPERLALVSELRNAIDNNQLTLVYQPKVDLISATIAGVEAQVRWNHPVRGTILPDHFIPVAEQTGLIRALTDWVMEAAAKQIYHLVRAGHRLPIAINLSTLNLVDPRLPTRLQNHCLAWSVDPAVIELEITESALMQDPAATQQVLRRLNEMGCLLYIDDFGTGYSSLGYLKKLPVDALKIDKSFVLDMLQDHDAHQIVRSTIDLAHDLGLKVVAEGVETQEVLARLLALGCDMVQGHHVAPPMEAQKLLEWLATTFWCKRAREA